MIGKFSHHLNLMIQYLNEYSKHQKQLNEPENNVLSESFASSLEKTDFSTCSKNKSNPQSEYENSPKKNFFNFPLIDSKEDTILESLNDEKTSKIKIFDIQQKGRRNSENFAHNLDKPKFYSTFRNLGNSDLSDEESENDLNEEEYKKIDTFYEIKFEQKDSVGLEDFYFHKLLNQGAYGKIWLASRKKTGDFYAIKITNMIHKV